MNGKFIISLDFELFWGVRDKRTLDTYGANILGVREAIPKMLETFENHKVKATFATVGFLFASSKKELLDYCPTNKPNYSNKNISPYNGHFDLVGENEGKDMYHFASKLIDLIRKYPEHEIATHTFSHYYCLEHGQTKEDFKSDILAAIEIARSKNIEIKSLVFPRNQFNEEYLQIIKSLGITSYRGNEKIWFHKASKEDDEKLGKRACRLLDSYLNISGHNSYSLKEIGNKEPFNIPSSRFLRPYSAKLKIFEDLRLRRILKSMTYAAKNGEVYHLWWHPHNFGINQQDNFKFLEKVLAHYSELNSKYDFESITMADLSERLKQTYLNE
jgi:peptidoglycan/xylan/chitin deacetylase (PgdA/CDA1 family)